MTEKQLDFFLEDDEVEYEEEADDSNDEQSHNISYDQSQTIQELRNLIHNLQEQVKALQKEVEETWIPTPDMSQIIQHTQDTSQCCNTSKCCHDTQGGVENSEPYVELQFWKCHYCKRSKISSCSNANCLTCQQEQYTDSEKKRGKEIFGKFREMMTLLGHNMDVWFDCLLTTNEGKNQLREIIEKRLKIKILEAQVSELKEKIKKLEGKEAANTKKRDPLAVLYMKDNNLLSFNVLHNIRKEGDLLKEIGPIKEVQTIKKTYDQQIEQELNLSRPVITINGHIFLALIGFCGCTPA